MRRFLQAKNYKIFGYSYEKWLSDKYWLSFSRKTVVNFCPVMMPGPGNYLPTKRNDTNSINTWTRVVNLLEARD
jgi:hypothetical protein